jgi:hypothetical protein
MNSSALEVAGKDDMGIRMELLVSVDVTKRPVLVALADQIIERAWGVRIVAWAAIAGGVQNADIEPAGPRRRIGRSVVFGYCTVWEAAAMKSCLEVVK